MDERLYWIWLQTALGVGAPQSGLILSTPLEAKTIFEAGGLSGTEDIDPSLTAAQRTALAKRDLTAAEKALQKTLSLGGWLLTPEDDKYPELLRGVYAPPLVLYGRGTRMDFNRLPIAAVVGTRSATENGVYITRRFAFALASAGVVVVSGGAKGLDSVAVTAAMDAGGVCVCFQACGIDIDYPQSTSDVRRRLLETGGAILTEYPPGERALPYHFRVRNRLISGIADATLVPQAPSRSGSLITAHWALEQGRDVYAVPGALGDPGCEGSNALLREGAQVALEAEDILSSFGRRFGSQIDFSAARQAEKTVDEENDLPFTDIPEPPPRPSKRKSSKSSLREEKSPAVSEEPPAEHTACPSGVSEQARRVFEQLSLPMSAGDIALKTDLPLPQVLVCLTELELAGAISCGAGQRYSRN